MTTAEKLQAQALPPKHRMTESEFESWVMKEDVRAEWVEGEVVLMSPVNMDHADIVAWLGTLMGLYTAKGNLGKLIVSDYETAKAVGII